MGLQILTIQLTESHAKTLFNKNSFWHQVMCAWCHINFEDPIGMNEALNEPIWYNSNILIGNKPVFFMNGGIRLVYKRLVNFLMIMGIG